MKRKIVTGILLLLPLLAIVVLPFNIEPADAISTTWTVDDDKPANFSSIQDAIDSPLVVEGDTIFVYQGTYYENVVVDKRLSFQGEDMHGTLIDGMGTGVVMEITVNDVNVTGFTIQGSGYDLLGSGIQVGNAVGINVSHNILRSNQAGILLWHSDHNNVVGNTVTSNTLNGIVLAESSSNIIVNNTVSDSAYGIALDYLCDGNSVAGNVASNGEYGISLWYDSDSNGVVENNVSNYDNGIYLFESNFNQIFHNNLVDNTIQAHSEGLMNSWDSGYPSCGNFWSNYMDEDICIGPGQDQPGYDGIWDHPYVIDGDDQDRYPLVGPWTPSWIPPWMPPEAIADLTRRKAWPEHRHFDISRDEDGHQTLSAKITNLSPPGMNLSLYVAFRILGDDGFALTIKTNTESVAPGEVVTLTASWGPLTILHTGKYYVTARCYYSYTGSSWATGTSVKAFSFAVVQ